MTIDRARTIISRWLHTSPQGRESLHGIVVRSNPDGSVYEAPGGLTTEEAAAVTVWLREALK